ncbi:MAG: hypothetical protein IT340_17605 [Chloroflexi bacterium]|nr:hypothetical protein [Chloroflexota bacterium]
MASTRTLPARNRLPIGAAVIRHVAVGAVAGLIAGIATGIAARLAMRLVVMATYRLPTQSMEGTILVLTLAALLGVTFGVLYIGLRRWLPGGWLTRGLVYGLGLLALPGFAFFVDGLSHSDSALREGPALLGIGLFSALIIGCGLAIAGAAAWLERALPSLDWDQRLPMAVVTLIALLGLGVALVFGTTITIQLVGAVAAVITGQRALLPL